MMHVARDPLRLVAQVARGARVVAVAPHLGNTGLGALPRDCEFHTAIDVAQVAGRLVPGALRCLRS